MDRTSNRQIQKKKSLKFHYSRTWRIPLKQCFLIFLLTWYGCYANQKKVMGFRGGTKTFCWVDKSPRLWLLILEVKREKMERPPGHSTTVNLLREMIGIIPRIMLQVKLTWRKNFPKMNENQQQFQPRTHQSTHQQSHTRSYQQYRQPFHTRSHLQSRKRMQIMVMTLLRTKGNQRPFDKRRCWQLKSQRNP